MANCSAIVTLSGVLSIPRSQNITSLIQECPEMCSLAWGKGNPDLSGIGAYASYILQVILTAVYGPLFHLLYISLSDNWRKRLIVSHDIVFRATSLLSIAIAIATIVRLKQSAVLYEVTFMYYLTTMQFIGLFSMALTAVTFPDALNLNEKKTLKRIAWITISIMLQFGLYIGALEWIKRSSIGFSRLPELQSACDRYGTIVPGVKYAYKAPPLPPIRISKSRPSKKYIILWSTLGVPVKIVLSFLMLAAAAGICYLIYKFAVSIGKLFLATFSFLLIMPAFNAGVTLAFTIGMFYCLGKLVGVRNGLAIVMGSDWEDNKWGFGQILAVFIWIPSICEVVFWTILAIHGQSLKNNHGEQKVNLFRHPAWYEGYDWARSQEESHEMLKMDSKPSHARSISQQAALPLLNKPDEQHEEPREKEGRPDRKRHGTRNVKTSNEPRSPTVSKSPV